MIKNFNQAIIGSKLGKLLVYSKSPRELMLNKVSPRLFTHVSGHTSNYVYVYVNPFKVVNTTYNIGGTVKLDYTFYNEPFYIGKAVSSTGHRHNQHVKEFFDYKNGVRRAYNLKKMQLFNQIEVSMSKNTNPNLPKTWDEYIRTCIIILNVYSSPMLVAQSEVDFIKSIGTVPSGPLINVLHKTSIKF